MLVFSPTMTSILYARRLVSPAGVPVVVDRFAECKPIYEEWAGWQESTVGITDFDKLPKKARAYLARIEDLAGVPVVIISTGPDREQTIIKTHPFE